MDTKLYLVMFLLLFSTIQNASAEIFKCTIGNKIIYADKPCSDGVVKVIQDKKSIDQILNSLKSLSIQSGRNGELISTYQSCIREAMQNPDKKFVNEMSKLNDAMQNRMNMNLLLFSAGVRKCGDEFSESCNKNFDSEACRKSLKDINVIASQNFSSEIKGPIIFKSRSSNRIPD